MKRIFTEDGNKVIEADGIGFIIPNRGDRHANFREYAQKWYMPIIERNGFSLEKNDWIVQVWAAAEEDLNSDNLTAHGFTVIEDGERMHYQPRMELLPASMFEGKVEGDVVTFDIPIVGRDEDGYYTDRIEAVLRLHMKLDQRDYRYRSFGNFEQVLHEVCR